MNSVTNCSAINYQAANIGVLSAPDSVGKATVYSGSETEKLYKEMSNDIYEKQSNVTPGNSYSTPKALYWLSGAAILTFLWTVGKQVIKK